MQSVGPDIVDLEDPPDTTAEFFGIHLQDATTDNDFGCRHPKSARQYVAKTDQEKCLECGTVVDL